MHLGVTDETCYDIGGFSSIQKLLVFIYVTSSLKTIAIRHVGAQTNTLDREITVRK